MKNKSIKCFEYGTLRINENGFTKDHFNSLIKFNDINGQKYFNIGFNKIKFKSFVGVLRVGDLDIEILPKGDLTGNKEKWTTALLEMLSIAKRIKLDIGDETMLKSSRSSLVSILFDSFLKEVEELYRKGLIKKYNYRSNNEYSLKGKLDFVKNIQKNIVHKERFYVKYPFYSKDNIYNQIIKLTTHIISNTSNLLSIEKKAKGISLLLEEVSLIKSSNINFKRLLINRKSKEYVKALNLAKMIIENYSPKTQSGQLSLISFLFDMNKLFEEFIYESLRRKAHKFKDLQLKVRGQKRYKFWNYKEIRPDILIEYDRDNLKRKIIIDVKWKLLKELKPSDADLKQIFAYNIQLGCNNGILLYPAGVFNQDLIGLYRPNFVDKNFTHSCRLSFIDPFSPTGKINKQFAYNYLDNILKNTN